MSLTKRILLTLISIFVLGWYMSGDWTFLLGQSTLSWLSIIFAVGTLIALAIASWQSAISQS